MLFTIREDSCYLIKSLLKNMEWYTDGGLIHLACTTSLEHVIFSCAGLNLVLFCAVTCYSGSQPRGNRLHRTAGRIVGCTNRSVLVHSRIFTVTKLPNIS